MFYFTITFSLCLALSQLQSSVAVGYIFTPPSSRGMFVCPHFLEHVLLGGGGGGGGFSYSAWTGWGVPYVLSIPNMVLPVSIVLVLLPLVSAVS